MKKVRKIGPAFSDFVTEEKKKSNIRTVDEKDNDADFLTILPLLILLVVIFVFVLRLVFLQILRGDYYSKLATSNRLRTKIILGDRGIIFDRNGQALVRNVPTFKLIENGKIKFLTTSEAQKLLSGGKKVESEVKREYLYKEAFAHVLGYLGQISQTELFLPDRPEYDIKDFSGKMGLEKQYESILHGENGRELYEVDVTGRVVRVLGRDEGTPGSDIITTLDQNLQLSVVQAFQDEKRGAVVASDPRSGGILALYSKPAFDPNIFINSSQGSGMDRSYGPIEEILNDWENQPLLNRAISGLYPPGSTFKLITGVSALESGAIKPDTEIEDTGLLYAGGRTFGNWYYLQYGKKEGLLDIVGAIKRSNDIFFYKAAEAVGVETIQRFAKQFSLGEKLGIDIDGESQGIVPSPSFKKQVFGEGWYLGDTYNLGIGQGYLLVTPLQVNFWTSVFANGGTLYRPHLIKGKKETAGSNFVKQEYIKLIREGMRQSCERGGVAWPFFEFRVKNERLTIDDRNFIEEASGGARFVRIPVACKTGTSEAGADKKPHALITVFAPFFNPEIVVTVLVENGGEGSSVAGPIAKKILEDYFSRK